MKKKIVLLLFAALSFLLLFVLFYGTETKKDFFAMDTVISVNVKGFSAKKAAEEIEEEILRLHEEYSVNGDGALYRYNKSGEVTEELSYILSVCEEIKNKSGGAFDAGVYPVTKLWGFTTDNFRVPTEYEIDKALSLCGTEYDFGAIAKGYGADKAKEILCKHNIKNAVVALGGTVLLYGNEDKVVAVTSPEGEGYAAYITEKNGVISTSGGYERYFSENGERYSHIMNPETGYPADNGIVSVTVMTDSGMYSDAYSTAVFVMGEQRAKEFWDENAFGLVLITADDRMIISEELEDKVSMIDEKYETEIWWHE